MNCIICADNLLEKNVKIKCEHIYCVDCFIKHMRTDNRCAICRQVICEEVQPNKDKNVISMENIMEEITDIIDQNKFEIDNLCNVYDKDLIKIHLSNFGVILGEQILSI